MRLAFFPVKTAHGAISRTATQRARREGILVAKRSNDDPAAAMRAWRRVVRLWSLGGRVERRVLRKAHGDLLELGSALIVVNGELPGDIIANIRDAPPIRLARRAELGGYNVEKSHGMPSGLAYALMPEEEENECELLKKYVSYEINSPGRSINFTDKSGRYPFQICTG